MKIIYIIKSFTAIAGTERVISNKINYLSEKGNDVCLITYEQGNHPLAFHLNKTVKFCDINVRFFTLGKYNIIRKIYLFKKKEHIFSIKLEAIIKDFMPDIIIFTTYSFKLFGSILSISTKYNIKTIIESHVSMNSIIRHYDFKKGTFMYYMTLLLDLQSLKYIRKADAIVSLTAGDAKSWKKYKKAIVIPNPINIYPNIRKNEYETNRRIISVGRLNEQKGYDLLIKAFSKVHIKHKDWIIDIYGDGEDKCLLNDLIKQNKLEEVVKINLPTVKIYEEYIKSDFFVLSSRYEGFGLVLAEAMSCGIPCIAYDCDYGPSEIITNEVNGLLSKSGDIDDLSNKINWMIEHQEERKIMGHKSFNSAKKYQMLSIMDKWISLFNQLCEN